MGTAARAQYLAVRCVGGPTDTDRHCGNINAVCGNINAVCGNVCISSTGLMPAADVGAELRPVTDVCSA